MLLNKSPENFTNIKTLYQYQYDLAFNKYRLEQMEEIDYELLDRINTRLDQVKELVASREA